MGGVGVLLVGRTVADVAVHDDQSGPVRGRHRDVERPVEHRQVVGVAHPGHVPAVAEEPCGHIVAEGEGGGALDGDPVVVVDPAQVAELQVAGQRGRLLRDALHEAAVPGQGVDVEVEHLEAGAIEVRGHPLRGEGHPHAGGDALPQGPARRLDSGGPAILGVARTAAVELAEALDVIEAHRELAERLVLRVHRLDPGEVQHRVEQHGGVAHRQHEAIAVGPDGVVRVEAEMPLPEGVGHRGHGHGGPRVAGVGLLDGVHGQRPDGVDAELIDVGHGQDWVLPEL